MEAPDEDCRDAMLEPGATASGRVLMTVLDGAEAVADAKARVDELRINGEPNETCNLSDWLA